jgi:hypothetical protein
MMESMLSALINRLRFSALFITHYIGIGRLNAVQVGDSMSVVKGCRIPPIIGSEASHYVLIGDCYVDGMMQGEVIERVGKRTLKMKSIILQ